jgi:hypothetical protein
MAFPLPGGEDIFFETSSQERMSGFLISSQVGRNSLIFLELDSMIPMIASIIFSTAYLEYYMNLLSSVSYLQFFLKRLII